MSSPEQSICPPGSHDFSQWKYEAVGSCTQQRRCKKCSTAESRTQHRLPEFIYLEDDSCEQARHCLRCEQAEEKRMEHVWGQWSKEPICIKTRTCSRCLQVERAPQPGGAHEFSEWKVITYGMLSEKLPKEIQQWLKSSFWGKELTTEEGRKKRTCFQQRHCVRTGCTEVETRTVHVGRQPKFEYVSANSCVQVQECYRCLQKTERVEHQWGEAALSGCTIRLRTCQRCKTEDRATIDPPEHDWGEWSRSCTRRWRTCSRCKAEDSVSEGSHSWGEWISQGCAPFYRVCSRCRQQETQKDAHHSWFKDRDRNIISCQKCGTTMQYY